MVNGDGPGVGTALSKHPDVREKFDFLRPKGVKNREYNLILNEF
jgi:hypothetical protein